MGLVAGLSIMLFFSLLALWRTRRLLREVCHRYGLAVRDIDLYKDKSERDSLTGAYNAGTIRHMVDHHIQETEGGCGGFVMLDVDYFKKVNDTMGHQAGDKVLKTMVCSLRSAVRDGDIIGRLGGDEFCIFLPNIGSYSNLCDFCNRIIKLIEKRTAGAAFMDYPVTISVGGVMLSESEKNFTGLYKRADKALYEAKGRGRNTCCVLA